MKIQKNKKGGYTILETMIAVSLFLVIIMTGMGALLNANLIHQKSRDMRSIMDNLSYIMEDLSRNLRTGYSYHCIDDGDLSNVDGVKSGQNCGGIAFEHQNTDPEDPNDQWVYIINDDGKILKSTVGPFTDLSSGYVELTPDEVTIEATSGFSVLGAEPTSDDPSDLQQPLVTIRLVGTIESKGVVTPFSLQTSVSQRNLDI